MTLTLQQLIELSQRSDRLRLAEGLLARASQLLEETQAKSQDAAEVESISIWSSDYAKLVARTKEENRNGY